MALLGKRQVQWLYKGSPVQLGLTAGGEQCSIQALAREQLSTHPIEAQSAEAPADAQASTDT